MRTIKLTKKNLVMVVMFLFTFCFMVQAQQKGAEEAWAQKHSQNYQEELDLTEEQANKFYGILLEFAKERNKILEENISADRQKKAIWLRNKEQKDKMLTVLTPEQKGKIEALWSGDTKKENKSQQVISTPEVPNNWAKYHANRLKDQLGLSDEQTDQMYEVLTSGAQKKQMIRETKQGNEQKEALKQITKEQNDRIASILTPEQNKKLRELRKQRKNK
jgi:Spy/CpxP family protein refolding chaperone